MKWRGQFQNNFGGRLNQYGLELIVIGSEWVPGYSYPILLPFIGIWDVHHKKEGDNQEKNNLLQQAGGALMACVASGRGVFQFCLLVLSDYLVAHTLLTLKSYPLLWPQGLR